MTIARKTSRTSLPALFAVLALPFLAAGAAYAQNQGEHGPRHPPPQAAFDACQSKKSGETCEVTFHEHTMSGTCATMPDDRLACRPDHPPGPPPELKAACADKKSGDVCSATLGDHTINGTCQLGHHQDDGLICHHPHGPRPDQPKP
jgi:hypothetical protein